MNRVGSITDLTLSEDDLQINCVIWFDTQFKHFSQLLFHIPNGGKRQLTEVRKPYGAKIMLPLEAIKLKKMGTRRGVCDLFLALPSGRYHGFFIEMKTLTGTTTAPQKEFMQRVEAQGYRAAICRSLDSFMREINDYMAEYRNPTNTVTIQQHGKNRSR